MFSALQYNFMDDLAVRSVSRDIHMLSSNAMVAIVILLMEEILHQLIGGCLGFLPSTVLVAKVVEPIWGIPD